MTTIYQMRYAKDGKGNTIGRAIGPKDSSLFIKFVDVFRDQGPAEGMQLFPEEWDWYDDNGPLLNVLDLLPVFASGVVMSDKAYRAVQQHVSRLPHAIITLDGNTYHWISPHTEATLDVFVFPHGDGNMCSEAFMKSWRSAGLTGCEFVAIR